MQSIQCSIIYLSTTEIGFSVKLFVLVFKGISQPTDLSDSIM